METKERNWYLFSSYCAVYLIRHCHKLISFNLKIWKWCILNTIFLMRKLRPREVSFLGAPVIKVEWTISRFLSSTLKIKFLILWNSALFYMHMCGFPLPAPSFPLVQAFWCFSDSKLREMLRWRWRLAAETMAAQLQNSLCDFVFIGYFQYIYWLVNWTMLTSSAKFLTVQTAH